MPKGYCKFHLLFIVCEQTGGEAIETSPPGAHVPPPGTAQQRTAPPPFYLNQQQLQMLQYLQQNPANLTPQQQVLHSPSPFIENNVRSSVFSVRHSYLWIAWNRIMILSGLPVNWEVFIFMYSLFKVHKVGIWCVHPCVSSAKLHSNWIKNFILPVPFHTVSCLVNLIMILRYSFLYSLFWSVFCACSRASCFLISKCYVA